MYAGWDCFRKKREENGMLSQIFVGGVTKKGESKPKTECFLALEGR